MSKTRSAALTFAAVALTVTACSSTVTGTAVRGTSTTTAAVTAAGTTTSTTTTSTQPWAHGPTQQAVEFFVDDLNAFWSAYGIHTNARAKESGLPFTCHGSPSLTDANAAQCNGQVLYSTTALDAQAQGDDYVVGLTIAHEVGHVVEQQIGKRGRDTHAHEIAADCLAGMYVAGKQQPRETTSDSFQKTGMYEYGGAEALAAYQRGYDNFDADRKTIANARNCVR